MLAVVLTIFVLFAVFLLGMVVSTGVGGGLILITAADPGASVESGIVTRKNNLYAEAIERYAEVRRRFPEAEMMMGIGNITELTAADSTGVNAVLVGICQELGIRAGELGGGALLCSGPRGGGRPRVALQLLERYDAVIAARKRIVLGASRIEVTDPERISARAQT